MHKNLFSLLLLTLSASIIFSMHEEENRNCWPVLCVRYPNQEMALAINENLALISAGQQLPHQRQMHYNWNQINEPEAPHNGRLQHSSYRCLAYRPLEETEIGCVCGLCISCVCAGTYKFSRAAHVEDCSCNRLWFPTDCHECDLANELHPCCCSTTVGICEWISSLVLIIDPIITLGLILSKCNRISRRIPHPQSQNHEQN